MSINFNDFFFASKKTLSCNPIKVFNSNHSTICIYDDFVTKKSVCQYPCSLVKKEIYKHKNMTKKDIVYKNIWKLHIYDVLSIPIRATQHPNFLQEIYMHKRAYELCPEHIIEIYNCKEEKKDVYVVSMEKTEGILNDILQFLSPHDFDMCFLQIIHIISILHKNKINHNDLHYANIHYKKNNSPAPIRFVLGNMTWYIPGEKVPYIIKIGDFGNAAIYDDNGMLNNYIDDFDEFPNYFNFVYDWIPLFVYFYYLHNTNLFSYVRSYFFDLPYFFDPIERVKEIWDERKDISISIDPQHYHRIDSGEKLNYYDVAGELLHCDKELYNTKYNTFSRLTCRCDIKNLNKTHNGKSIHDLLQRQEFIALIKARMGERVTIKNDISRDVFFDDSTIWSCAQGK